MSFIDAAFKQSQTANNTEQAHLAYQQTKQLAFYKKLSMGLAGITISTVFATAGFYSGQYLQSQSQQSSVIEPKESSKKENIEENTKSLKVIDQPSNQVTINSEQAQTASIPQVAASTEQYQWMSVQVGLDAQGKPVYTQQLVPVSAIVNPGQTTARANIPKDQNMSAVTEDLSQYRVLGKPLESNTSMPAQQEDLSQYRVLGKPLSESSNIQTSVLEENVEKNLNVTSENQELENEVLLADEAAARLKAAFDLAVAETENKDFSSQEIEETQSSEEQTRLAIELLPAKTQLAIGKLTYQAHIYASLEHKRWIKINGVELYEGDKINGMRLLEIAPESSVFRFQGYDFTVKAMQDWQPY